MRRRFTVATALGALALGLPFAAPAAAATDSVDESALGQSAMEGTVVGDWRMNEPVGATVMQDTRVDGRVGTVGPRVRTGVPYASYQGYRFTEPVAGAADIGHLVLVDDAAVLNPDDRDVHLRVALTTTDPLANLVQKGQAGTVGGRFKVELTGGVPSCYFEGSLNEQNVRWGSPIDDGQRHTITCDKFADRVRISVDDQPPVVRWRAVGTIHNYKQVSIGGKSECDGVLVDCDYFTGSMGRVLLTFGSRHG